MKATETLSRLLEDELLRALTEGVPRHVKLEQQASWFKWLADRLRFLGQVPKRRQVFIPYRHKELIKERAEQIDACLGFHGIDVFRDVHMIRGGDSVRGFMHRAAGGCRWVVAPLCPEFFRSVECMVELEAIVTNESLRHRLIPMPIGASIQYLTSQEFRQAVKLFWQAELAKRDEGVARAPDPVLQSERDECARILAGVVCWMELLKDKKWFEDEFAVAEEILSRD